MAQAAVDDGLVHQDVARLASIGGQGKHPGNTHRDLLLLSGSHFVVATAPTGQIPVLLQFQTLSRTLNKEVGLDFLLPHKLFSCIYHSLPSAFTSSILGGAEANIPRFWEAMRDHPVVLARPELRRGGLDKVVPLSLHGDGVAYMQTRRAGGKSLEVLSWASMLCKGSTKTSSFLIFLLVKNLVKATGFNQSWQKVWKVLTWSLDSLRLGVWPLVDWEGKEFSDKASWDYTRKGTPLADGFSGYVFLLKSDIEFLANHFKLNSPSSNEPCSLCRADRSMNSRPWTDCRPTAAWKPTVWTREAWSLAHPLCHPLFQMHGGGNRLGLP